MNTWKQNMRLRDWLIRPRSPVPEKRYRVVNLTRNTVLADRLDAADTATTRRKGLLGRSALAAGEGLWIVPCESVHTFGMRFAIDLIYLDRKNRIKKVRTDVGPSRLSMCLSAHSVLELPPGTVRSTRSECQDVLEISLLS